MKALSLTPWIGTLDYIIDHDATDTTTRTLARILKAIILEADDERTARILDHYANELLEVARP